MSASLPALDSFTLCSALPLSPPGFSHSWLLVHLGGVSITGCRGSIRGSIGKGFAGPGRAFTTGLTAVCLVVEIPKEDDEGQGVSN